MLPKNFHKWHSNQHSQHLSDSDNGKNKTDGENPQLSVVDKQCRNNMQQFHANQRLSKIDSQHLPFCNLCLCPKPSLWSLQQHQDHRCIKGRVVDNPQHLRWSHKWQFHWFQKQVKSAKFPADLASLPVAPLMVHDVFHWMFHHFDQATSPLGSPLFLQVRAIQLNHLQSKTSLVVVSLSFDRLQLCITPASLTSKHTKPAWT